MLPNRDREADYSATPLADPDEQFYSLRFPPFAGQAMSFGSRIRLLRLMIRDLLRKLNYTFLWMILGYGSGNTFSRSLNPASV